MKLITTHIPLKTNGHTDIIDITRSVQQKIGDAGLKEGQITLFVQGSTGALTTMEFEPNLSEDIKDAFEKIAPEEGDYAHHMTWGDHNGHSHVRASLLGPSLTIPFREEKLCLGSWQQIVFIDFDTSGRDRILVMQLIGK